MQEDCIKGITFCQFFKGQLILLCYSVTQLCPAFCDPMDCSPPGSPVLHCLLEFAQTHVHWVNDAIQPSHPLSPSSPLALNLSQHQEFFPVSWLFTSGSQSIGASAPASVLPINIPVNMLLQSVKLALEPSRIQLPQSLPPLLPIIIGIELLLKVSGY